MKKILSILGLVTVIGVGSFAFASESDGIVEEKGLRNNTSNSKYEERIENRREDRMNYHRADLKKALENGEISQEDAKKWEDHYNYMDEFHSENGSRGCHSKERGMRRGYRN